MRAPHNHPVSRKHSAVPESVLREMIEDQKRTLRAWGVAVPDDRELFGNAPLAQRARLFDYMIRQAIEAEFV